MNQGKISSAEMQEALLAMGEKAKIASRALAVMDPEDKNRCLLRMADALLNEKDAIKAANAKDIKAGEKNNLSSAMLDRLRLTDKVIDEMAAGLKTVAGQTDPVGKILSETVRPNGLVIKKISVPLGVIGIIYESRPNVTVDAAGICLKAGNAVILRGGSEAFHSNVVLAEILNRTAILSELPDGAVQLVPWTDREAVGLLVKMDQYLDLIIPRGGEGLIRAVCSQATVPVLKHYKGVCHLYLDENCDSAMALKIIQNAKCQRPSACNAMETLLINRTLAPKLVPELARMLNKCNVAVNADFDYCQLDKRANLANDNDFYREYLDYIMNVKLVDDVVEAVEHINKYGSRHSDGIISGDENNIDYFFANVDSSTLYANASTRFTDGGEFGMGAEIGISTDKLHARGPMGADELTSYKYIVRGNGQIR